MGRIESLQRQIDALNLELARVASMPEDDFENFAVMFFEKRYSGSSKLYHYVALKVGPRWFITGNAGAQRSFGWDELCEFIGDFEKANVYYATEWREVR